MSADFWAGYISGAAGIIIGNPLDLIKVRLQAGTQQITPSSYTSQFPTTGYLVRGATAPVLGYGALNALLFMTYNRTTLLLSGMPPSSSPPPNLWTTWLAGAVGGLATWVVSTPTELVKCRAQASPSSSSTSSHNTSLSIARTIFRTEGIRGLYFGGVVTALRDSIGYGFYFWSYELGTRLLASKHLSSTPDIVDTPNTATEAARVLLCGGIAGVITWASIFPLDVIKTRVQTQLLQVHTFIPSPTPSASAEIMPLLSRNSNPILHPNSATHTTHTNPSPSPSTTSSPSSSPIPGQRIGALEMARQTYQNEGLSVVFRGLGVCSVRAFIVNAAQWAVYEWIMRTLVPQARGKVVV